MAEPDLMPLNQILDKITVIAEANPRRHLGWSVKFEKMEFQTGVFGDEWLGWSKAKRLRFVKGLHALGVKRPYKEEEND